MTEDTMIPTSPPKIGDFKEEAKSSLKDSFFDKTFEELRHFLQENSFSPMVANQLYQWAYKKLNFKVDSWQGLSGQLKKHLPENLDFSLPVILWQGLSQDGTRKFLLQMKDGQSVEAVAIPSPGHLTLCLSSQVGCAIGCTFCHTGTQGFKRNLRAGEIVGQFVVISRWLKDHVSEDTVLTNIVYMGQGEPLHNFEQVKKATLIFLDTHGLSLSQRKITLSTSGLVPQMKKLKNFPAINLAISLHSPFDEIRNQLIPLNKTYNLQQLFQALEEIPLKGYRRISFEYLLIDQLTNRREDIEALVQRLQPKRCKINLIPFNEYPGSSFKRPSLEKTYWFAEELRKRGFVCTLRVTKGHDILAACGQLKTQLTTLNLWTKEKGAIAT